MRRISLLLISALATISLAFPAFGEDDNSYDEKFDLLISLGVLDEIELSKTEKEAITRAEFAGYIVKFTNTSSSTGNRNVTLKDVPKGAIEEEACYTAVSFNLMEPALPGYFYPAFPVSKDDAIVAFLRALGYSEMLNNGVSADAVKPISLLKDVGGQSTISRKDVYTLMYNALFEDVVSAKTIGADSSVFQKTNKNALHHYFGILEEKGVIQSFSVNKNKQITINNLTLDGSLINREISQVVGRYVYCYWDEATEKVIHIKEQGNTVLEIDPDQAQYQDYIYTYGPTGKKAQLKNPFVFLNEQEYTGNHTQEIMIPSEGSILLIDNNRDGLFEYAFIQSIENYFVTSANETDGFLIDKFIGLVPLNEYNTKVYNSNKIEIGLMDIKENSVVSILQSGDLENFIVYLSTNTITGRIQEIRQEGNSIYLNVEGSEYRLTEYFHSGLNNGYLRMPEMGREYVFHLNINNRIVFYESVTSLIKDREFGVLTRFVESKGVDETYTLKIFSKGAGGFATYELGKSISLNQKSGTKPKEVKDALRKSTVFGEPEDQNPVPQLIEFGVNGEGQINYIQQPYNKDDPGATFHMYMGSLTTKGMSRAYQNVLVVPGSGQYKWDGKPADYCGYTAATECIQVPYSNGKINVEREELYVSKAVPYHVYFHMLAYKKDPRDVSASVLILPTEADAQANCGAGFNIGMVDKISKRYVDDEEKTCLTISGKDYFTDQKIDPSNLVIFDEKGDPTGTTYSLKKGDLVNFLYDANGNLRALEAVYDYKNKSFLGRGNTQEYQDRSQKNNLRAYRLYYTDSGFWICTTDFPENFDEKTSSMFITASKPARFFDGEEVVSLQASDMIGFRDGGERYVDVVMFSYYNDPKNAYIYKN